ncbi:MAG TPA: glycosyltransferase family 4 protein [Cyclobacteriaceae bacterium]
MKILILHQHFKTPQSGGAIRSYYLAKALVEKGHRVVVITAHNEKAQFENLEGIEVHYLSISYDNRFGFYARGRSFLAFISGAIRKASDFKDFDYCYAISVPLTIGIAAMRIKSRYNIPFIFEVGDLWPDAPIQMGFVNSYFLKQFLYGLEKRIYQSAKSIIALSTSIKTAVEKKVPGKTVHLIPNMADTDFYKPEVKSKELVREYNVEGKFVVSYIGALGVANGLDYFLDCARASQKANLTIHFFLCGDGAMLDHLGSTSKKLQLQNLTVLPFKDRKGVQELMNVTDASFICYKSVPILETGSPNKFFDGLAAGKMIIINFGGWIKKEIEENRCGFYVDPNHPTDFVKKIESVLSDSKQLDNYKAASRALAERKYSREQLSKEFAAIFKS